MTVPVSRIADARRYGEAHDCSHILQSALDAGGQEIDSTIGWLLGSIHPRAGALVAILRGELVLPDERSVSVSDLQTAIDELLDANPFRIDYCAGLYELSARLDLDRGETD